MQASTLKTHSRVHSGKKPYKCKLCVYSARQPAHLRKHLKTHSKEKPYECQQCSYTASDAHTLKTHLNIHSEEKPYRCQQCSYSARQSAHLKRHMRMHGCDDPVAARAVNPLPPTPEDSVIETDSDQRSPPAGFQMATLTPPILDRIPIAPSESVDDSSPEETVLSTIPTARYADDDNFATPGDPDDVTTHKTAGHGHQPDSSIVLLENPAFPLVAIVSSTTQAPTTPTPAAPQP